MEKIIVFNDYANSQRGFQGFGFQPDFGEVLDYLSDGRFLVEAHAYVPIDPRNPHGKDREIEDLWRCGYMVHSKVGMPAGDTYKCDFDVEITMDLMRAAEIARPDIVVLISGDKDFIPVILELRKRGIRVEVAAFPEINAAREVMLKASGFIDLGEYVGYQPEQSFDDEDQDTSLGKSDGRPVNAGNLREEVSADRTG